MSLSKQSETKEAVWEQLKTKLTCLNYIHKLALRRGLMAYLRCEHRQNREGKKMGNKKLNPSDEEPGLPATSSRGYLLSPFYLSSLQYGSELYFLLFPNHGITHH